MRDIFADIFAADPLDPTEAARRHMRPSRLRRFYAQASVEEGEGDWTVLLDGRSIKTPARATLAAPSRALAEAVAAEWTAQQEHIDAATMPLTRLANSIIDGVAAKPEAVAADVGKYLGSDLLCYRAEGPDGLIARQISLWDPVLVWARDSLGARFVLAQGMMPVAQPEAALAAARTAIPEDPWRLGAVHAMTTLTGSGLLALAVLRGRLSAAEAWLAAHVDEDWNMDLWGRDALALERRAVRFAEMRAAAKVIETL